MLTKYLLKEYLNKIGRFRVNDTLWIPYTKIGVHPLELEPDVLLKKCPKYIRNIETNVEYLKKYRLQKKGASLSCPESLYKLIESWNMNALMEFSREITQTELQYFQDIDEQCFYSVIYHNVLHGKTDKRGLRLHFFDVSIPVTFMCEGVVKSMPIDLKSMSKYGMLFKVNKNFMFMMEKAKSFEISLDHKSLFECWNESGHDFFSVLPFQKDLKEKKEQTRAKKFSVNMNKVSFSSSLVERAISLGRVESYYLCVPFEAFEDPVLLTTADYGKVVRAEIDEFQRHINDIVLAS